MCRPSKGVFVRLRLLALVVSGLPLLIIPPMAGAQDSMTSGSVLPNLTVAPHASDELFVGYEIARSCSTATANPSVALAPGIVCPCRDHYGDIVTCNDYLNKFWRSGDANLPNGRIPIYLPITQFFWNENWQTTQEGLIGAFFDGNGFLTASAATLLKNKNLLPSFATLTLRVYDVDSDINCGNDPPCYTKPEVDHIYVNGI